MWSSVDSSVLAAMSKSAGILGPGIVWSTSLLAALLYALRSARRDALDPRTAYWTSVVAIVFGLWGGRLLGIVYYSNDQSLGAWLGLGSGGRAEYGALIAGTVAALIFLKARNIPVLGYADALVPAAALGVAVGRIGCFLNGDDFGTVTHLPWAVRFSAGTEAYADHLSRGWIAPTDVWSLSVHPIQLYDSLVWLGFFAILVSVGANQQGLRVALWAILHGAGRFVEQFFRGDFQPALGPLSLTHLISLLFITVGLVVWLSQRKERCATPAFATKLSTIQDSFADC